MSLSHLIEANSQKNNWLNSGTFQSALHVQQRLNRYCQIQHDVCPHHTLHSGLTSAERKVLQFTNEGMGELKKILINGIFKHL